LAAACDVSAGSRPGEPSAASTSPATIVWTHWATDDYGKFREQRRLDLWQPLHPEINVDMQPVRSGTTYMDKLTAELAAGVGPDVFRLSPGFIIPLALQNQLVVLDELFKGLGKDNWLTSPDLRPGIVDFMRFKGKLYSAPMGGSMGGMSVNRGLVRNAGRPQPPTGYDDPTWTYERVLEDARSITKRPGGSGAPPEVAGISLGGDLENHLETAGGYILTDDYSRLAINEPPAVAVLQWLADLRLKHRVAATPEEEQAGALTFQAGKMGIEWSDVSAGANLSQNVGSQFDWDIAPWPRWGTNKQVLRLEFSGWVLNAHSKFRSQAARFLAFVSGPVGSRPGVELSWEIPIFKSLIPQYGIELRKLGKNTIPAEQGLDHATKRWPWRNPKYTDAKAIVTKQLQEKVWPGLMTPRDAMLAIKPAADQLLQEGMAQIK
jgi:multiple sugar transport system substrate-binding protein